MQTPLVYNNISKNLRLKEENEIPMNCHDMFDNNNHLGDIETRAIHWQNPKGISNEKCSSLPIIKSSFMLQDVNNAMRGASQHVPAQHNLKKKRNTRERTGSQFLQTIHYIESAKDDSNSTRKRRRRSYDNHEDYEPFPLYTPINIFPRPLHNNDYYTSHHSSFAPLLSPQEHQTMMLESTETSATALCSASESSFSINQQDDAIHNQKRFLVESIRERFRSMLKDTRLRPNRDGLRSLRSDDVIPAHPSVLGVGTFSRVTRVFLKGSDGNRNENNKRYACKQLKRELSSNPEDFAKAATELAYEAYILSCFDHPNIIKLRGLDANGIASFANAADDGQERSSCVANPPPATSFFLIMDVLQETLDQRIDQWNTSARPQNLIESHQRTIEKISLCRQLASVLEYIHSKGVVYRDLKPQNIGFCEQEGGKLKLFDFGLSKELPLSLEDGNEHMRYQLSGAVGTVRYMAPEVCLSQPYNRDCDIYSWSIVSWEIWSQIKPFESFTPDLYKTFVCRQGFRPTDQPINSNATSIPHELEALLKEAWKSEPHQRIHWSGIQRRIDDFQRSEELRLHESFREASMATDRYPMGSANNPLLHSPVQELQGAMNVSVQSPWMNSNGIGAFSTSVPAIIDRNVGFGEYPRRALQHNQHLPNIYPIAISPDVPSMQMLSP